MRRLEIVLYEEVVEGFLDLVSALKPQIKEFAQS